MLPLAICLVACRPNLLWAASRKRGCLWPPLAFSWPSSALCTLWWGPGAARLQDSNVTASIFQMSCETAIWFISVLFLLLFLAKQVYIEYKSPNPTLRLDLTSLKRSRRKINCYPEESSEEKYQTDSFFSFKSCWSEIRGWILDQTSVAVLQSNTPSLWRCKQQLLQLALMNGQLFVGASRAIRLPARRAVFVTQLHPSDWVILLKQTSLRHN